MAISSPLDITWDHAYWTEGPEFVAAAPVSLGGLKVGWMSLNASGDVKIGTWPDEVGTADAVQATAANQPYYSASSATLNGVPVVHGLSTDNVDRHLTASFGGTTYGETLDVVVIGRAYVTSGMYFLDNGSSSGRFRFGQILQLPDPDEKWTIDHGGTLRYGGYSDTNAHLFRIRAAATDVLYIDEVANISASAGSDLLDGLTLMNTVTNSGALKGEVAFYGVKSGGLSAGNISDLHAYCQSHYGTA